LSGIGKLFLRFFFGDVGELFVAQFNITLLFAILLVLLTAGQWFKNGFLRSKFYISRGSLPVILLLFVFYLWMICTLLYSPSPRYSYTKTLLFLTNLVAFLFPLTYKDFNFQRFLKYFVFFGSVFIVLYLAFVPRSYAGYVSENLAISAKYLDIGYLAALNVLLLILLFPHLELKRWVKFVFIGINLTALMITGARGPLVFLMIVLLMRVLFNPGMILRFLGHLNLKKVLVITISIIILVVGLYSTLGKYATNIERTIERLKLVTDIGSSSLAVRFTQLSFSFDKIFENLFNCSLGHGIGSFGILYAGEDRRLYPHNIIIETWFEMGMVGVILLLLFLFFYLKKIKLSSPAFYIFFYLFLNSLKSSSLVDLRIMFGIFACLLVFTNWSPRNGEHTEKHRRE
jgi:O-antigen ligase